MSDTVNITIQVLDQVSATISTVGTQGPSGSQIMVDQTNDARTGIWVLDDNDIYLDKTVAQDTTRTGPYVDFDLMVAQGYVETSAMQAAISALSAVYQVILVSGINIKTVNGSSLLGSGNITAGDALVANPLSQFAATTSLQLKGVISDETGSGALVFATSPTLVTPDIGAATGTSLVLGSGNTVTISGGNITARGQIFSDRTTTVAYVLSSAGANYGHLYVYSSTQWALGYGPSTSTLGTAALIWGPNGIEIVAGLKTKLATKTANYSVLVNDYYLRGDATSGAITLTLPTAVGFSGQTHIIKKIDSSVNAVVIATTSSQTIDGTTTLSLLTQYNSVTLVSNGANWDVI